MADKFEEKITILECEHHETLVSDAIPDKLELWKMAHDSLDVDGEVCRPDWYEIPISVLKQEIELEEFKTDF